MMQAYDAELDALLSRVALSDRRAFDQLYEKTSGRLFAVAVRMLKNHAEAEEVCQDAFVRIWQRSSTYQPGKGRAITWMTVITRNLAIDRLRRVHAVNVPVEMAENVPDGKPSPEANVSAAQTHRQIEICLEELKDKHADAVRSAYMEGYSYKDLAARYNTPLNTMRTWLRRGLMRLKTCMEAAGR